MCRYGRHISFNVEKREFLCPLCECLSNTVVPLLPPVCALVPPRCLERAAQVQARGRDDACFEAWLEGARAALQGAGLQQIAVQGAPVVTTEGPSSDGGWLHAPHKILVLPVPVDGERNDYLKQFTSSNFFQ